MRKYYIDNLRWSAVIVLTVYHAAMAWNIWGEPNYILFAPDSVISAVVVTFSPFLMPLLFVLAGISTKYALTKRTPGQYLGERVRKLLIPFVSGTVLLMPVLTYLADKFNCGYTGSFFEHYAVFFTKFTDMTGADGGFSVGQFWFLLYLFVISLIFVGILKITKDRRPKIRPSLPLLCLAGIPILLLHELLPIGGKSLPEYLYLFLLGYYILSDDGAVGKLSEHRRALLITAVISTGLTVYLFLCADQSIPAVPVINTLTRTAAEWSAVLAALGLANSRWSKGGALTGYMSQRSFLFYILHYVWIVLFQYLLAGALSGSTALMFFVPVILAYAATFLSCEVCVRIPALCFLTGTKPLRKPGKTQELRTAQSTEQTNIRKG